ERRVIVDRKAGVLDLHRHDRELRAADVLDFDDLADLDARDPHRRVEPDVGRRLEHRLELERLPPGKLLRERQEGGDHDQDYRDHPRAPGADPALEAARYALAHDCCASIGHFFFFFFFVVTFCSSVTVPWLPGTLPITCLPAA